METKLKECPFCPDGGKPQINHCYASFYRGGRQVNENQGCVVECAQCDLRMGKIETDRYGDTSGSFSSNDEAIKAWNTRAPSPATDALVEALRAARRFIHNGRELGYIKMPEDLGDPAWRTCSVIDEALAAVDALKGG